MCTRAAILALAIALAVGGCSLVVMDKPTGPAGDRAAGKCTTDRDMPWWDLVIGGVEGTIGVGVAINGIVTDASLPTGLAVGGLLLTMAAGHLYSGKKGFSWARECEELRGGATYEPAVGPTGSSPRASAIAARR